MLGGLRQLAIARVAELGRQGIGADRIYRTIRDELGAGYTRRQVREDVFPFRSPEYLQRYSYLYRARPERTAASLWQERDITTSQREEWLWEVRYNVRSGEISEERYASFTSDEVRTDEEILQRALDKATDNLYGEVESVEITGRWHRVF
jgi:hypothetical protein